MLARDKLAAQDGGAVFLHRRVLWAIALATCLFFLLGGWTPQMPPQPSNTSLRVVPSQLAALSHIAHDALCRPANATIAVATSVVNIFAQVVLVPALQAESNIAVIPEQEEDHIWVDSMVLHHFNLRTLSIQTANPDEHSMRVNAAGFGLEVNTTRFRFSYFGIRCYGHFSATLNETDMDAVLSLTRLPEGRWNATFPELTIKWGTLAIQHALDSKACGMAQSVVELFTGQMDEYIAKKVKSKIDEDGKRRATEVLNEQFAQVDVRALTPPVMTAEKLAVSLDITPISFGCPPQPAATELPQLLNRHVAVHTTVRDVNNLLYNAATMQRLRWEDDMPASMNTSFFLDILPELYKMCPDCPMYSLVEAHSPPVAVLLPASSVQLTVQDVLIGLFLVPRTAAEREALQLRLSTMANDTNYMSFADQLHRAGVGTAAAELRGIGEAIPVLALLCGASFSVKNVSSTVAGRDVFFTVQPMYHTTVEVVASNIGDVDSVEIAHQTTRVWNGFIAPMLNAHSPYRLPFFLRKASLAISLMSINAGVNVGVVRERTVPTTAPSG